MILASNLWSNPGIILLLLIVCFALVALLVFLLRKLINRKDKEEKPHQEQALQEDLDRYLEPIDDEDAKKQFDEYEKEHQENKD